MEETLQDKMCQPVQESVQGNKQEYGYKPVQEQMQEKLQESLNEQLQEKCQESKERDQAHHDTSVLVRRFAFPFL